MSTRIIFEVNEYFSPVPGRQTCAFCGGLIATIGTNITIGVSGTVTFSTTGDACINCATSHKIYADNYQIHDV